MLTASAPVMQDDVPEGIVEEEEHKEHFDGDKVTHEVNEVQEVKQEVAQEEA